MLSIDTDTRLCAVIGNPVGHSLSPQLHNAAFAAANLNYVYLAFEVEDVPGCLTGMRALPSFRGMSVTIPHKVSVMSHLDEIDPAAKRVGSVNTIVHEGKKLTGYTTDGAGSLRAFAENGVSTKGRRVLFLGAGGAVRAVAFAIAEDGDPDCITILGRTRGRVDDLVNDVSAVTRKPIRGGGLDDDLVRAVSEHDFIIQGTPVGMAPEAAEESLAPPEALRPEQVVFDMVYRPNETKLLLDAAATGCRTVLGREMLLYQGVLQFELWTGQPAPTEAMRKALTGALAGG